MKSLRLPLAVMALLLAVAGCARREPAVARGIREQVLHRGNSTEPESLDPHLVRGAVEWTIVGSLFEGLVTPDPATLEPRPGVAESWEVSADGLKYTFRLRADARWGDGRPLVAGDFVFSARRMLSPRLGSAHAENNLLFVAGAADYQAGRTTDFATVGIVAPDERTVVITLARPAPFFLSALHLFFPVPEQVLAQFGAVDDRSNAWARAGRLVGNGPFRLKDWTPHQTLVIERNPAYWDAAAVRLREVHFHPIENPSVEENAFRNGQLHQTSFVPLSKIAVYQREQPDVIKMVDDRGVYFYSLNVERAPFRDVRVRRALALAVDREALAGRLLQGGKRPAPHFTPEGMDGYTPPEGLRFDPAEARRLLAEAGYPDGRGFPEVELLIDAREHHRVVAEAVQMMWRTHLNVRINLLSQETQMLNAAKRNMEFQMVRGSWNATTYQDPVYFLGAWRTGALYNEAKWSNPDYDRLIEQTWTADRAARHAAFRKAEEILLEEVPVIPLYFSSQVILVHPAVRGWVPRPFADRRLKHIWLER